MADARTVDVAVVGAGPAGLAAAIEAASAGARVVVIDQSPGLGGQIWRHRPGSRSAVPARAARMLQQFESSGSERLVRATVVDAQPRDLRVIVPDGVVRIRAGAVVLATGARERFLPFPGWTLPNVVGVGGLQALVKTGLELDGKRVVVAGTGPLLFPVAATATAHGARVALVAEQAPRAHVMSFARSLWRSPAKLLEAARYRAAFAGTPLRVGCWVVRADGQGAVERAVVTDGRREWTVPCDVLATAAGLIPNIEVGILLGCRTIAGALAVDDSQATSVGGVFAAGECTGVGGEDLAVVEGAIAGLAAVNRAHRHLHARRARLRAFSRQLNAAFAPRRELLQRPDAETVVCRCEDVRLGALQRAWGARQGKLATRAGMGACQGRICGAALECLLGWESPAIRPPLAPASVAALAAFDDTD
jgi:NADPH-dependent 2,4-dienoyl-CoA reductase/sulfur reductase-like enzyme